MKRPTIAAVAACSLLFGACSASGEATDADADGVAAADVAADATSPVSDATSPVSDEAEPVATTEPITSDADAADVSVAATSCDDVAADFSTTGSANDDLPEPEVVAACDGESVVIASNGIPDYTYIETSPGTPAAVDLTFTIPAAPTTADEVTDIPLLGTAAVAVNGVPIYGPTEGTGGDVLSLVGALSDCGSHNGPTGFHIHLIGTSDATDCLFTPDEVAAEPQLVGYALDGFPIYTGNDQYDSSWQLTDEALFATDTWAAHSFVEGSGDLDECNGLTDAEGRYAYYTTDTFPYVLGCYSGVVDLDAAGGGGGGPGGPPPGA